MGKLSTKMNIFSRNKILAHLRRLADFKEGKNPPPITMSFTLTDKCNNTCTRCFEASGRLPSMPSIKEPKRILKECAKLGVKAITFSGGGEPLVYPGATSIIEYAKSLGMDVGLVTNGCALNEVRAKRLAAVCTWVRVSLDASNAQDYQYTHGMPEKAFRQVLRGLEHLVKAKKDCTIGVGYLTGMVNRDGIVLAAKLMRELGVDYINYRPFQGDKYDFNFELKNAKKYETENFKVLFKPHKYGEWWKITYPKCYFQYFYPLIGADGKLYPCCEMRGKKKYSIGSLYRYSLKELWQRKRRLIDFEDCTPNCIGSKTNQFLNEIFKKKEHENFL